MRDAIFEFNPSDKLRVLKSGGTRFFKDAEFESVADGTMKKLILPLSRSGRGRRWLIDRASEVRPVLKAATAPMQAKMREAVTKGAQSADEDQKHWAEMMRRNLGIK